MYRIVVNLKEQALFHLLLYFASKDGAASDAEINKIIELCGLAVLSKITSQEETNKFYEYNIAIDDQQAYLAYLIKTIGKANYKLLFFYCCQICFADMEFDSTEKKGLDILAYILDLDKRQKLTIEQVAMEMKLSEVEGIFIVE